MSNSGSNPLDSTPPIAFTIAQLNKPITTTIYWKGEQYEVTFTPPAGFKYADLLDQTAKIKIVQALAQDVLKAVDQQDPTHGKMDRVDVVAGEAGPTPHRAFIALKHLNGQADTPPVELVLEPETPESGAALTPNQIAKNRIIQEIQSRTLTLLVRVSSS